MIQGSSSIVTPHEALESELKVVHTDRYIESLTVSAYKVDHPCVDKETMVDLYSVGTLYHTFVKID